LGNLLSNAFKFTQRGTVELRLELGRSEGERVQLRGRVSDTGSGISTEDRARLFQPFSQLDHGPQRRVGGTGLGLTICQQLATLMDGHLDVGSTPGAGSSFVFDVWLKRSNEPPLAPAKVDLRGRRLLGIDDRLDFLHILREQGQALGMEVQTVAAPREAVAT